MAKTTTTPKATTGLNPSTTQRYHYDIYAILEGTQEMYFGEEVAVNVNLVEKVKVPLSLPNERNQQGFEEIDKCYISPTKRRGVERRTLIWAPMAAGMLLGDHEQCGIPLTCSRQECPICCVYGALQPKEDISLVGRLTHGGGVAIQPLLPDVKQRAMHPSVMTRVEGATPMPYRREYNEPALLYPVYNHCLSITEQEFESVAYAFLNALGRIGAGNPKGVRIADGLLLEEDEPLLVVDRYLAPLGMRPTISPQETNPNIALRRFRDAAFSVFGERQNGEIIDRGIAFTRWIGNEAMHRLQQYCLDFTQRVLL